MRKQILVVDDDPLYVDLVRDILAVQDIEVVSALNGTAAFDLLKTFTPLMIVSDFEMPGMNGMEFHARLQLDEATRSIPFIFMRGSAERTIMQYCRARNVRVFSKTNLVSDLIRLASELK